jgi:hypothetical protein
MPANGVPRDDALCCIGSKLDGVGRRKPCIGDISMDNGQLLCHWIAHDVGDTNLAHLSLKVTPTPVERRILGMDKATDMKRDIAADDVTGDQAAFGPLKLPDKSAVEIDEMSLVCIAKLRRDVMPFLVADC